MFRPIIPKRYVLFTPQELNILSCVTDCSFRQCHIWMILKRKYPNIYYKLDQDYLDHYHKLYLLTKNGLGDLVKIKSRLTQ